MLGGGHGMSYQFFRAPTRRNAIKTPLTPEVVGHGSRPPPSPVRRVFFSSAKIQSSDSKRF